MNKVTCFLLFFVFLSGCSQMTTTTRQTQSGKEIAIGQFAPKTESECTMVHNEELPQSLLQGYVPVNGWLN